MFWVVYVNGVTQSLDSCGVWRATGTEQFSLDLIMKHSLKIHIPNINVKHDIRLIRNRQFSLLI